MAELDQPFNLTMLTVDTHHVGGWVCDLCGSDYSEKLANVVKCADNLILNFVTWCQEQPWYEDTVIVIQGDHPRMDSILVDGATFSDRRVYYCFINSDQIKDSLRLYNHEFTAMDMFPSVLSSLGYNIPGDRLAIGTNLFSPQNTLSEEFGMDYIDTETGKYSQFYIDKFS